ncbi:DUF2914 domain-containing protein [Thermodesulfobacteriota bacterium]
MKHMTKVLTILLAVLFISGSLANFAGAEEGEATLSVLELKMALDVVEREPVEVSEAFGADVERVYCFSKIKVDEDAASIFHVWYFNGEKVTQVELNVKRSPGFRTHSNKAIMNHQKGAWKVEVQDSEGNVLQAIEFTVS